MQAYQKYDIVVGAGVAIGVGTTLGPRGAAAVRPALDYSAVVVLPETLQLWPRLAGALALRLRLPGVLGVRRSASLSWQVWPLAS